VTRFGGSRADHSAALQAPRPCCPKHPEFYLETLEYTFDGLTSGTRPPEPFRNHRRRERAVNLAGFTERHLDADLFLVYRVRRNAVVLHRIGTHQQLFAIRNT
jgi:mRNA-degrading endonuclease YafQ of YafQ-DinJ toxin-antitoxin module